MKLSEYRQLLERYNRFQECIILDYWSENFCRDFAVLIDNVWLEDGVMRSDLNVVSPVRLLFQSCDSITIDNAFSDSIIENPNQVNCVLPSQCASTH